MRIEQIMTREVVTIAMDDDLHKADELFAEHGFHHLLVMENGRLVGVISDRDLLRHLSPFIGKMSERTQDLSTLHRRIHQVMTRQPVTVRPEAEATDAANMMLAHRVSCLPVVTRDGHTVGIVSWRDLLRHFATQPAPA